MDDASTLQLPASANLAHAPALAASLAAQVRAGSGALRVDASALQAYDSATLALLLDLRRQAQAAGRSLTLTGLPAQLLDLARLYGVEALLDAQQI